MGTMKTAAAAGAAMQRVVLGLLLCLLAAQEVTAQVEDFLGFYRWTATEAYTNDNTTTTSATTVVDFPATTSNKVLASPNEYHAFRVFKRSNKPDNIFYIQGMIAQGNDFVVPLALTDAATDSVAVTSAVYATAYVCFEQPCKEIAESVLSFQNETVVPIFQTVDSIKAESDTLTIEGPRGRFQGVRTTDPLLLVTTSDAFASRRGRLGILAMGTMFALLLKA